MDKIVVICGPTAVGKTEFAIETALDIDGEIVSCDSMQLYKYMDIGSAKPTAEEQAKVTHYLVDEIDPAESFSVVKYQAMAKSAISEIIAKGKIPVIAGGTGLYLNSLLYDMDFSTPPRNDDYRESLFREAEEKGPLTVYNRLVERDPEAASRIHPNNVKKVVRALEAAEYGSGVRDFATGPVPTEDYESILIGLARNREELYDRINRRVDILIDEGLVNEVRSLMEMGLNGDDISMKGIGYKEIIGYLKGEYDMDEAVRLIKRNTRHLAKRQMTWFRRYKDMKWFNISDYENEEECLGDILIWLKNRIKP
ncbi:tRNA (adenosine(37)-N6)-dimethylallyltransferase MiaA [Aminicella lysinilytica]|uniref:tRNA (adenosine(37)-N6)-dimethylallyltransferase MiaA n=1 Tax=Aminicella lysinilytica TaxID=433323 RepID=UPI0026ECA13C|nr:tRNA (adenosine(37)-N6)-dimethylallyltransferase MiaA [Aminicella lysinilytica]